MYLWFQKRHSLCISRTIASCRTATKISKLWPAVATCSCALLVICDAECKHLCALPVALGGSDQVHWVQGEAVRSVLETSLSTLPFPPSLESILRCWLSSVQSVERVFSSQPQSSSSQHSAQTQVLGQLNSSELSQVGGYPVIQNAAPAVIPMGSLLPVPTPAVATARNNFLSMGSHGNNNLLASSAATATTAAGNFPILRPNSATAGPVFTSSGIPRHRILHKQLSTGTYPPQLQAMLGTVASNRSTNCQLPGTNAGLAFSTAAGNSMGSIASLVSAGLLPQGTDATPQAMQQQSLGHLAALLDLPNPGRTATAIMMPTSIPY